jgi:hypothetical protein
MVFRSCFLGLSEVSPDTIIKYGGFFNWPKDKSKAEIATLAERVVARSEIIRIECAKYQLRYFDMAQNYRAVQYEALDFMLADS